MDTAKASREWSSRPSDQRYTSLLDMAAFFDRQRAASTEVIRPNKLIHLSPGQDEFKDLMAVVETPNSASGVSSLTHHSFGQLAALAGAPAGYLRTLAAPIAADNINYGLRFNREAEDVGLLSTDYGLGHGAQLRSANGPRYGRVWNSEVVGALVDRFGDGINGDWRVPGEFGKAVDVTKANTTLFASDRDMFVFLADELNRVEMPDRRDGKSGSLARGFFIWNSEVGAASLGIGMFLFDYACCNRIVWGGQQYVEVNVRHTAGAPGRWLGEIVPAIESFRKSSTANVETAIAEARAAKLQEDLTEFLGKRFGKRAAQTIQQVHMLEEQRPIETMWDVVVGATAYARGIEHQDARVAIEAEAGKVLDLFAVKPLALAA